MLQGMVHGGRETITGITRRAAFGPLIMFGLGGIFVEAIQDVVFRIAPIDASQATEMVTSIRGVRVLTGMRGAPPCDLEAIATVLRRIGQLAIDFPQIQELDVNPLMAMEHGVVAVDARARISTSTHPAENQRPMTDDRLLAVAD
jgi:acyl-CoA synthetase (NDP forming)